MPRRAQRCAPDTVKYGGASPRSLRHRALPPSPRRAPHLVPAALQPSLPRGPCTRYRDEQTWGAPRQVCPVLPHLLWVLGLPPQVSPGDKTFQPKHTIPQLLGGCYRWGQHGDCHSTLASRSLQTLHTYDLTKR